MEMLNKTKTKDVVPEKGGAKVGDAPEKGKTNTKGPEKGGVVEGGKSAKDKSNAKGPVKGGEKSMYSRFLSAISTPTEASSSSHRAGSRPTRSQPLDEDEEFLDGYGATRFEPLDDDVEYLSEPFEDEYLPAPPVQAPPKAPAPKGSEGKATKRSKSAARRDRMRLRLPDMVFDDSSPLASSTDEDDEERPPPKPPAKPSAAPAPDAKRGRGRPPTTGEYVGLAAAKQALVQAQRAELELASEKEIVERASTMATARRTRSTTVPALASQAAPEARAAHAQGLKQQIADSLSVVAGVAKVSKGLKGTLQKALKEAVSAIQEASEELLSRTSSEEVALLRAANSRMESEIADLRSELRSLQAEVVRPRPDAAPPAPPNAESAMAANLDRMTLLMESRFAAMEERLRSVTTPSPAPTVRPISQPNSPSVLRLSAAEYPPLPSQRASLEKAVVTSTPPPPACPASQPPPAVVEEGWSTVNRRRPRKGQAPSTSAAPVVPPAADAAESAKRRGKRGGQNKGRGKKAQESSSQPPPPPAPSAKKNTPKPAGKRAPRLRPPKSAAVVLTLQPGAAERGVTFGNLFSKAKARIRLADLGIEGGLRLKKARTGARMLLLPGADSAPLADALAERLRIELYPEDVRISRPEKTVCLRVSGLDDHTEDFHVAAAIAQTTGCTLGSVKVSKVRPGPDGMGQTVVACPVAAAKKLISPETKLLVGWASALVTALPHRTQRCYRCHAAGHVAAMCTSEVDRSGHCYRCGQAGHLVTGPCTAKPHCSLCEAAGKPAGHQLGSRSCGAKPTRRNRQAANKAPDRTAAATATPTVAGSGTGDARGPT